MSTPASAGTTAGSSTPIVGVVGCGVTGSRAVAHLVEHRVQVAVHDPHAGFGVRRTGVVLLESVDDLSVCDLVVLCQPAPHASLAERLLMSGVPVVSISDDLDDLQRQMIDRFVLQYADLFDVPSFGRGPLGRRTRGFVAHGSAADPHEAVSAPAVPTRTIPLRSRTTSITIVSVSVAPVFAVTIRRAV